MSNNKKNIKMLCLSIHKYQQTHQSVYRAAPVTARHPSLSLPPSRSIPMTSCGASVTQRIRRSLSEEFQSFVPSLISSLSGGERERGRGAEGRGEDGQNGSEVLIKQHMMEANGPGDLTPLHFLPGPCSGTHWLMLLLLWLSYTISGFLYSSLEIAAQRCCKNV